jgi:hypothetical protein
MFSIVGIILLDREGGEVRTSVYRAGFSYNLFVCCLAARIDSSNEFHL